MDSYSIGIDTGGTCTDGVLISNSTLQVAYSVKEPTTHHDLGIGVGRVLQRLLASGISPEAINRLSVSTTLATNAVVEGRGARVGLLVFGHVRHFKLPVTASVFMKGGHKITGDEDEPLDVEGLVDAVRAIRGEVDSYAVCSAMSIKNPVHELVAEEAIAILDPKPVFCSHQVSGSPGMHGRAATACLHARLMPLMVGFLSSVQISMLRAGLSCPVTIICGSGRGAGLDEAVQRAAITVASGPAATARFGCTAGEQTALVVDVGGTTTDVCMIRDGHPVLSSEGCRIGQWQTHIEAVDMYTAGGGGDSHVICSADEQEGCVRLATARVQPLSMTVDLPDPADWLGCGLRNALIMPIEGLDEQVVAQDEILRCLRDHGPVNPETLAWKTGLSGVPLEKRLERLANLQQIRMIGFTPTDALHVLSRLAIGNKEQAERGAAALAAALNMEVEALCLRVVAETEQTIETIILDYLAHKVWPASEAAPFLSSRDNSLFSLSVAVKIPIIGIGAASRCFLPAVAERLRTSVSFPEHYEVGNAVGAALIGREEFPA
ncbi:MAG: N-methylhydantoinase A/oxoprolinase/acetone carboxylase, beta subunit [Candidatus Electronema aureum]|uniref:N-methylhydantoinase A/oxoprolinase/acetone carboxylase, beta subunit n=1 Tax=Candidatus Electronema aureum TaxID=2005002 RepID=A0A521G4A0_9BACT|nr:MAG: N-methylhydantoinase A/oxoprolinase/acetone carboxylase, beta subunit [Candidatus Electronema aureum]